jgi:hypothetical protein
MPDSIWLLLILAFVAVLPGLIARRHNIVYKLRAAVIAMAALGLTAYVAQQFESTKGAAIPLAFASEVIVLLWMRKPRRRRIPKSVRRSVIAKWEKKTGLTYDPQLYHLDHVVPFSDGGSHTVDNLRVLRSGENLQKGRELPQWDLWGRLWQYVRGDRR